MPNDPTADQRFFQTTTREFLTETVPLAAVRTLAESGTGFDRAWWRRGAELGWMAMLIPENHGGGTVSGRAMSELALVAGEFGRACAPGPFVTTNAALAGLTRQADRWAEVLGAVQSGDTILSWAVYEPGLGFDVLSPADQRHTPGVRAEPDGDGYRLTGVKDRVESADQADLFLVTAESPDGPIQLLVPANAPGVSVTPAFTLDLVRRTGRVSFEDVAVPADSVAHTGSEAVEAIQAQAHTAAVLTAAEMVGATDRALEATLTWLFDRYTFGRPLASYQALKHRMADNKTWLEASKATATAAANAWDDAAPELAEYVSIAKSYVGAKAPVIAQDCVQLHGGIGVTWEHDLHLFLRRITLGRALYGTPEEHRRRISDLIDAAA
ncbi:acyl-CoA dehydrogenase family protein [Nocardia bovistercoris]|uniref:Acyl-CoA/acyl-ACP dehydrogenase n=1 Tax=Nocardia bovistercoris TaxID=2785916 RepID=A0A931N7I0_9NOCA|nr:acyl-CoA dehydrogenase family protein [Nocardia bovistercoris]MBH0780773.1 acyl-CoA/acyl-ACP dehydrogenase [Nocardia bovistercoris]